MPGTTTTAVPAATADRRVVVRVGALLGLAAVVALGLVVPSGVHAVGWELVVMRWTHVRRGSQGAHVAWLITELGSEGAVGGVAVGLAAGLLASRRFRSAAMAAAAVVVGSAGAEVAKHVVGRRIGAGAALAYPSGHTAGAAAAATTVALVMLPIVRSRVVRWIGAASTVVVAAAVGLAMVARGSHYPADVIGGLGFGALVPLLLLGGTVRDTPAAAPAPAARPAVAEVPVEESVVRAPVSPARRFGVRDTPLPDEVAAGGDRTVAVDAGDGRAP